MYRVHNVLFAQPVLLLWLPCAYAVVIFSRAFDRFAWSANWRARSSECVCVFVCVWMLSVSAECFKSYCICSIIAPVAHHRTL